MASRGALVCFAVLCAALSAAVVAGDAVQSHDLLSNEGAYLAEVQGGRKLLSTHDFTPAWVSHDGKVYAFQGNFVSGNTLQVGGKGDQQANSAAVNNAQINKHSNDNGAVYQSNSKSGRKLLCSDKETSGHPAWIKDGKVFAFQGNILSGNTVQISGKGDQQANSAAVNNAQTNDHSNGNGAVWQGNSKSGRKLLCSDKGTSGHPAWIKDGKVFAFQGNILSGNTVQITGKGNQQANSAAVNNAQTNDHSNANGAVGQGNSISGRKLLTGTKPATPAWVSKDGKVFAFQGNLASGNTLQFGDKGDQQGNSAALNNAQINKHSDGNGAVQQWNSINSSGK